MAFLFNKFQEAVKVLAKSAAFAGHGRHLQFQDDINRLFLFTSYKRLGRNAEEADADEIIDMASKASLAEQQKEVQENIHLQISSFCKLMNGVLLSDSKGAASSPSKTNPPPSSSGLGFAVGRAASSHRLAMIETKPLTRIEVSLELKELTSYTLEIKPSQIQHKDAGEGLFLDGEANVGSVVAFFPGVTYSPAYYPYIPGYPRVDLHNPYLITRYDDFVINAQPWGRGGDAREMWDGSFVPEPPTSNSRVGGETGSDRVWRMLSKSQDGGSFGSKGEILERRNPLAFAHFANHPPRDVSPNVMVCPYDFPLSSWSERDMRAYIPNISFGNEEVGMKKFGAFWFKSWKRPSPPPAGVVRSLVLVATRGISNEEILLNYRLSNSKKRPSWYVPVNDDEDRRRWS
ncbi:hypothetical protein M569_16868 [Genlisea aurea]|uniref:SET domain-containing protein n=1 Tax=Genlisea aurea TaxID=192259 RepID=S8D5Q7_9LAMI|nr:hypothetical protein M569_16868 [Genlisea aurea]